MISMEIFCGIAVIISRAQAQPQDFPNLCPQSNRTNIFTENFQYGHPDNCSYFITCSQGIATKKICPPTQVWSNDAQTCVQMNSAFDKCSLNDVQQKCLQATNGNKLLGHPKHCQRYYNCSKKDNESFKSYLGKFEEECSYPKLFDDKKNECRDFKYAFCSPGRVPAKDPCDYLQNTCKGICTPCRYRWPSCVNLKNGKHPHPKKLGSPYFVQCYNGRTVEIGMCQMDQTKRFFLFFSPVIKKCVTPWAIPRKSGGWAPTCAGRPSGGYRTEEKAYAYYRCPKTDVYLCSKGSVFNETSNKCVPK